MSVYLRSMVGSKVSLVVRLYLTKEMAFRSQSERGVEGEAGDFNILAESDVNRVCKNFFLNDKVM